jgi:hypothetical protein
MRRRNGLVILVPFVLAVAAACGPATPARPDPPAAAPAAAATSQKELRAQFEQHLGQHALLAVRVMRSVVTAQPELRQALTASLQENTNALTQLVASAYGGAEGDRFEQLWQRHVTGLLAYSDAVVAKDSAAKQRAQADLMAYCDAYGAWFAGVSDGQVRARDAVAAVRVHVEDLTRQLDAYAARDHAAAYRIERQAYERMFSGGAALAKASVTPELAVGFDTPPERLRSAFAMLLGEHMELIVDAQRAAFAGSGEFDAAAAQVNANTSALTKAMGTIVGPRRGAEFESAWASHVEGLMAHTAAVAGKDAVAVSTAERNLEGSANRLALYFSEVVENRLPVEPLTAALTMHDTHLIHQVNAYAARDYTRAQQMELEGYRQMLGVANTLVDAIQRTVKPRLPVGGSRTGGGGTARRS